jgi:hypothetical protein
MPLNRVHIFPLRRGSTKRRSGTGVGVSQASEQNKFDEFEGNDAGIFRTHEYVYISPRFDTTVHCKTFIKWGAFGEDTPRGYTDHRCSTFATRHPDGSRMCAALMWPPALAVRQPTNASR